MVHADIVQHYRRLRGIADEIQTAVLKLVPSSILLEVGRRIGAARKDEFILDEEEELKLVNDLVIHVGWQGRSRAIDRYARTVPFQPGSDSERVLTALQKARFAIIQVKSRHEVAGAIVEDMLLNQDIHMMDIALGMSADELKPVLTGRMMEIDGFHMSTINLVPVTRELMELAASRMRPWRGGPLIDEYQDPFRAIAVYRAAIEMGYMQRCVAFDVVTRVPTPSNIAEMLEFTDRPPADWLARMHAR